MFLSLSTSLPMVRGQQGSGQPRGPGAFPPGESDQMSEPFVAFGSDQSPILGMFRARLDGSLRSLIWWLGN